MRSKIVLMAALALATLPSLLCGQTILNSGFEEDTVSAGGFVKPATGPWTFSNDAGVVRPFSPNSSTGPLNTWSATFAPIEGQQYVSTYAAADLVRQGIFFGTAGDYRISSYAAAPDGSITIPGVGTQTLVDGEFSFVLGNLGIGGVKVVPKGSSWALYSTVFTIPSAGTYDLGIRNTLAASYFINYDAFAIQSVPEPASVILLLGVVLAGLGARQPEGR